MTRAMMVFVAVAVAAPGVFAAEAGFEELLPAVAGFDYGNDAGALKSVTDLMTQAQADPARLHEMTVKLAGLLPAESTTDAARLFICRQLYLFGDKDCIPYVAPLLLNAKTVDMACYAIARMPGAEAPAALAAALEKAEPGAKVALINALGQRGEDGAVDVLAKAAGDPDKAVAYAAVCALGGVGTTAAVDALMGLWQLNPAAEWPLICAASQISKTDAGKAADVYRRLYNSGTKAATRAACLKALAGMSPAQTAVELAMAALAGDEAVMRTAAAAALRELPAEVAEACAQAAHDLPPAAQVMVLQVVADRGTRGALPAVAALAASDDADVRLAAVDALAVLGDASTVPLLANLAAGDDGEAAKAARRSLALINGPAIDDAIVKLLESGEPAVKSEMLAALVDRNARQLVPEVLEAAADPDDAVRSDAFKTMAKLGRAEDVQALIDLLVKETSESARAQAEAAVVAVARKANDASGAAATALAAFPGTEDNVPARAALVHVLGKLGDDSALEALRGDLVSTDAQLQEASVRALSEWPTAAPSDDLLKAAEAGASETIKKLALRGYLRLVGLATDLPVADRVAMYEKGLKLASEPGEKVAAISGLAECPSETALALIRRYENDPDVEAEVKLAMERINNPKLFLNASDNPGEAGNATDGDPATRWTTGKNQEPWQWFLIDLGWPAEVLSVRLDATGSDNDFPKAYEVYVSNNPDDWGEPVAKGKGDGPITQIECTPKAGRHVCIFQTGQKDGLWWSIHELKVEKRVI